jgi:hypothetical protein
MQLSNNMEMMTVENYFTEFLGAREANS